MTWGAWPGLNWTACKFFGGRQAAHIASPPPADCLEVMQAPPNLPWRRYEWPGYRRLPETLAQRAPAEDATGGSASP